MKHAVILLALICGAFGSWESGLRVRFDIGLNLGKDFFIPIARTMDEARSEGWTETTRPSGPLPTLVMYCSGDRMLCAHYDPEGIVAGLQIAVPKNDISGSTLDWHTQGFVEWTATTDDGVTSEYWAIQQYFVSEATLSMNKEDRIRATRSTELLREGAVWVTGFNGELMEISNKSEDIENSLFTRQACIPWMGRHYYYNMTSDTSCESDTLLPWFPIVHSGQTIGSGLIMHGGLLNTKAKKNWFETPNRTAVQLIVPDGPECLYALAADPGIVTIHIYYVNAPWFIGCLFN